MQVDVTMPEGVVPSVLTDELGEFESEGCIGPAGKVCN